ncbi:hypothetical protein BMR1_02g01485 [Babesia microti strain RI]|uniref:RAP domain-containing protein n=1 Tax=Babesia microti (strain RI) TaxID=1133968 RepID=A0A1R4AA83_BABMR|nr:hypothetical protein BMR1_02g01485 [Babesia microti strain RI]SJK85906.1 hypothetical protein BMR1_02g01485 [Babesia microti strain RI]|eukprot:XP_021338115.1 hypothetical protein BMR1_02g01485 [Babesia microti strain RI]
MYNILWIITNNVPFWISGLECDEWIVDVIKFFDIYKQELSIQIVECESVNEIRKILDTLNVTHQPIISHHCSIPIHIQNTNLTIHYPRGSDLYYKTNEFVPRYQLYLDILRKFGWDPVSISPIEWNRIRNNQIDVCKSYIKKILLNYYKKFIIK